MCVVLFSIIIETDISMIARMFEHYKRLYIQYRVSFLPDLHPSFLSNATAVSSLLVVVAEVIYISVNIQISIFVILFLYIRGVDISRYIDTYVDTYIHI